MSGNAVWLTLIRVDQNNGMGGPDVRPTSSPARIFATTHWSVVIGVQDVDPARAEQALETLCRTYWPPLYSYLRRAGFGPEDAEDLIQGFFEELLELRAFDRVDPEKGRFRTFLLASLKKFVACRRQYAMRQKRGGGRAILSLDLPNAERHYGTLLGSDKHSPDQIFERQWAATLLRSVIEDLRAEAVERGQGEVFEHLQCVLTAERPSSTYAELAARLNLSESAIKMAAHRLRARYAILFREAIARTVERPEEVDEEIAHLFQILGQ